MNSHQGPLHDQRVLEPSASGARVGIQSRKSIGSIRSMFSILSMFSVGSLLSIGSAGSMLSIGSRGGILRIGGRPISRPVGLLRPLVDAQGQEQRA